MSNKRPEPFRLVMNEFDKRTSSDLRSQRFSGIRTNEIMRQFEIWIAGQLDRTVAYSEFWRDPDSLTQAYCRSFGIMEASLRGSVEEVVREMQRRKRGLEQLNQTDEGKRVLDESGK